MRSDPEKLRAWQQESARRYEQKRRANPGKGLARTGRKARRELDALSVFREVLRERSGGGCEVETPACPPYPHHGCDPHHLNHADRDRGVHDPERGLWVCRAGHDWIEQHPDLAREAGWLMHDDGFGARRCLAGDHRGGFVTEPVATVHPDYAMNRAALRDLTVDDLRDARLLYEWVTNHTKIEVKPFVRIATESAVVDITFEEYRAIFGLLAEGRWDAGNGSTSQNGGDDA